MKVIAVPAAAGQFATLVEKYVVSMLFIFFGWQQYQFLRNPVWIAAEQAMAPLAAGTWYSPVVIRHVLLLIMQLFFAATLLANRAPSRQPEDLVRDIFVPLTVTFFFLAYSIVRHMPAPMREVLAPGWLQVRLSVAAIFVSMIGYLISLWSVFYLGRSFALLISIRRLVGAGPYRYVRHPIYAGYMFILLGLVLASPSVIYLLLTFVLLLLTIYRARLEERRLAEHSEQYREYMHRTGFLFPRLRRAV